MTTTAKTTRPAPAQSKTPPARESFASRPFAEAISLQPEHDAPDIQTQLANAQHFGHSFANTNILPSPRPAESSSMTVRPDGDSYEQAADRVAAQVGGNTAQASPMPALSHGDAAQGTPVPRAVERDIRQARGNGQPLDNQIQGRLEQAMGADLSGVRVHTDGRADQASQALHARAFTTGQDVFFRQGAYQPDSREGQALIAHEVAHTAQQSGGAQGGGASVQRTMETVIQRNGDEDEDVPLKKKEEVVEQLDEQDEEDVSEEAPALEYADRLIEAMRSLRNLQWMGSGAPEWRYWLNNEISQGPSDETPTEANCWNAVLLAAYKAGLIGARYVRDAALDSFSEELGHRGMILNLAQSTSKAGEIVVPSHVDSAGATLEWWDKKLQDVHIPKGYIIHMEGELASRGASKHVCLSTGGGKVIELDERHEEKIENPMYGQKEEHSQQLQTVRTMMSTISKKEAKLKTRLKKLKKGNPKLQKVKQELRELENSMYKQRKKKDELQKQKPDQQYIYMRPRNEVQERPLTDVMATKYGGITRRMFWAKLPSNEEIKALVKTKD